MVKRSDFRILVIDDDEIAKDVVVSLLMKEGFSVTSARDGLEGIKEIRTKDFDLIITDLKMPGADGIEVLKEAKRLKRNVLVVIITAYGTLENAIEAIRLGAYDYITKPFKLQELLILVENAMKKHELMKENEELREHLKSTYRDMEMIKALGRITEPTLKVSILERIARLRELGVLDDTDVAILKEQMIGSDLSAKGFDS
ncbi:MAG: response regulator [Nitrospirae bacterium]|nr:response regulator [Nitrospirota bacterium]